MGRLFRYIRYLGVVGSYDTTKQKSIILMNEVLLVSILFSVLFSIINFLYNNTFDESQLISLVTMFFSLALLYLNSRYYTQFSKVAMCIVFPISILIFCLILSTKMNLSYFFILSIIFVMLLFRDVITRSIFIALNILGYIIVVYYRDFFDTTYRPNEENFGIVIVFMIYIHTITLFMIARFGTVSKSIQNRLQEVLGKVEINHKKLQDNQIKIEEQNKRLGRTNEELEKFAYIASHDLKSPLRNITSFMNLIQRKLKDYPDESVHEYLNFATSSAKQMHFLVNDILEYSKLGDKKIELSEVNLNKIIEKVEQSLQAIIQEKNAVIETDELPTIFANITQMQLLFQNLIENGIKYNKQNSPTIQIRYEQTTEAHLITFKDNGIGIPKEYKEKVFEMFQRLQAQSETKGSGIGLAICMKIVEQHQGKLWLESTEGKGSTFFVTFPKKLAHE